MQGRSPSDVIKPEVRAASAYTLEHVAADVKLDQNENPYELPQEFKEEVARRVVARPWGRYPEFVPSAMTQTLAKHTGWTPDGILVGNGSNELLQAALLVTLGQGRTVAIPQPTFTLYKLQSTILQATVVTVPLRPADLAYDVDALGKAAETADVTVICSPNNPTGTMLPDGALQHILEKAKGIVLLDEAYHEFSGQTALGLLANNPNLVITRTFSKALSMAGMRFGYMLAHPEIAREIHKAKLPYNVNIFTLTAAQLAIERGDLMSTAIQSLISERQRLVAELRKRMGVRTFDSAANFILIRTAKIGRDLFNELYAQGVLVRDVSNYPMLERVLRVTVGTPEQNNRFLAALDTALPKEVKR
jgi:histidinol-phosphate aminotransferase